MFETWPEIFSPSMRRVVDPPVPVLVELGVAIARTPGGRFGRDTLPMRVKAGGLDLSRTVPGRLLAWARCSDGSWLGLVEFMIATGNDRGRIAVTQWCGARALRPDPGRRIV
ncbi:hypothetical protein [Nocardia aurantia]|uniref:Uncharacterized protein n=1 Tax=Nocardia aurantia TaxID=2585199 RepID=A0A7K0DT94_9NOCA|nr:hypothetical protein [Nocardia aurantia]MQY28757.1 hypothetical protein [Nocardia aurantia]